MKEHYTKYQEDARKDFERAFGVLQARFEILKKFVLQWDVGTIEDIMMACIILHNMIIKDEQRLSLEPFVDWDFPVERPRHHSESCNHAPKTLRMLKHTMFCKMIS